MESDIKTIQINIRNPWWYTWWAITIYALIGIALTSILTLFIRRKVNKR